MFSELVQPGIDQAMSFCHIAPTTFTSAPTGAFETNYFMTEKILLAIDDDELILRMIKGMGEESGYDVVAVQDANYLETTLSRIEPDLIILDLVMPNYDGIEVLRTLADKGMTARLLLISGFDVTLLSRASKLAEAWGLNVVGSVDKPLDAGKLSLALKQIEALG